MIAKLTGIFDDFGPDWAVIDVAGVGYLVQCSARTLDALGVRGDRVTVHTDLQVSENDMRLIGFASAAEREWFRLLQTVQGIGTKVALAILSTLKPADLATAISMRDKAAIARSPGVGPRVAERVVTELKDKAPAFGHVDAAAATLAGALEDKKAPAPVRDAVSALVNLGYGEPQAASAVAAVLKGAGDGADTAKLIRLALKEMSAR